MIALKWEGSLGVDRQLTIDNNIRDSREARASIASRPRHASSTKRETKRTESVSHVVLVAPTTSTAQTATNEWLI